MRVIGFALIFLGVASAGVPKPQVTVGINVGEDQTGSLGGLEPRVKWAASGQIAGVDVEGGIDLTISDLDEPPATGIWGKLKTSLGGLADLSIRGDMDANARDSVGLDMTADAFGASLRVIGQAGKVSSVDKVALSKGISVPAGTLTVVPQYSPDSGEADVRLGYTMDGTSVVVDAQAARLTVSHALTEKDTVSPTVSAYGDVSLSYSRSMDAGKVTATWTPDDSVQLAWSDGTYQTTFSAPLEGYYQTSGGIRVNVKRSVNML